ncbi:uncharacterized protein N7515_003912 [Penicillium bovifimosum]|uniref:Uncharacterized protein n=1 Tax=Penicillium bovifimosum TaxID=126998 RepID=A0A9W9L671_9EURO|nr:uncharacterized protein N7515_003912 [Penicillium bovifimosum]KAJ5139064.1 hypothetical protein N7515_003912 [Penicillium bovifimosum]
MHIVWAVEPIPTTSTVSPTRIVPRSTRPVATVPRPAIENPSSTGIKNGRDFTSTGVGIYASNASPRRMIARSPNSARTRWAFGRSRGSVLIELEKVVLDDYSLVK